MTEGFNGFEHRLSLSGRRELLLSGVNDVDSFDERMIIALTKMGELTVKGEGLKILSLNTETGDMNVCGDSISSLTYSGDGSESGGFFKRLFK